MFCSKNILRFNDFAEAVAVWPHPAEGEVEQLLDVSCAQWVPSIDGRGLQEPLGPLDAGPAGVWFHVPAGCGVSHWFQGIACDYL